MTNSENEWHNEWQRVTTSDNKWQSVTASDSSGATMKTAQYTSKNGGLPSFQWQKQTHYYFKGWIAAIGVVKLKDFPKGLPRK